ncbi:isoleucine--tRNA ligase, mitochondrial-like [Ylistrum balloti]|uniref:isoleucine--tRNA ligase, mitochondrial-like n=1 Tax=Ylistrum balloti TaxID=509963 RepID=UPI002905E1C4|nr:isoleucine--tRNA ligase, mitochondrial-like [Ylistrum balloti]
MFSSLRLRGIRFPNTSFVRFKSKSSSKRYSETLNLPKSDLVATSKSGKAIQREQQIQEVCGFSKLYEWQRSQEREKEFVLHDGPPYANGKPHVGHALNKILKDITNRYKLLKGYKIHYIPGWDCHGLPIELKAIKTKDGTPQKMTPLEIRRKAKKFAEESIQVQSKAFQSWGVMADWKNSCYHTVDREFQARELDLFYTLYQKGLVYEDFMPVYWSPSSRTALAEAELEYNPHHVSQAVYLGFPVVPSSLTSLNINQLTYKKVYAVIWTTTPWTLPVNQAICYNDNLMYCLLQDHSTGDVYVCEKIFVEKLVNLLCKPLTVINEVKGKFFNGAQYTHPLTNEVLPFLPANHVVSGKGTGFVHTAPCHGHDDFKVAFNNNITIKSIVDDEGVYTEEAGQILKGKTVGKDADSTVIEMLKESVIHKSSYQHSYPYDWRTKQPVIIRASKQWFINTNKIKDKAVESLSSVDITPNASEHGMLAQLKERTYWCISRQRAWGLPIPVFYHKVTGKALINSQTIDHLKKLFTEHGSDCWWSMSEEELLPKDMLVQMGASSSDFTKGGDILDIWFDSGSSWSVLHKDGIERADLYLEGLDQFGGWFQSSLLTSIATNDIPPYRQLVVHGFAVDEDGKKMSKSVGNVVDPEAVIYGGKNQEKEPSYGVDVLRWWTAQAQLQPMVLIGPSILQRCNEDIFKIRKVMKFVLGNIHDFQSDELMPYDQLWPQDKYMLYQLYNLAEQVTQSYDSYRYGRVLGLLEKFTNIDLSAFYCSIIKDRLYCTAADDKARRSAQTVLYHVTDIFVKSLAPIVPHLAEELHQHFSKSEESSVFKSNWFALDTAWADCAILNFMQPVLSMKEDIDFAADVKRPVEFDLTLYCSHNLHNILQQFQSEVSSATSPLTEILQTSYTHLTTVAPDVIPDECVVLNGASKISVIEGVKEPEEYVLLLSPAMKDICERCRRYTTDNRKSPCDRCLSVLADGWA